jgi:hypothetical protein
MSALGKIFAIFRASQEVPAPFIAPILANIEEVFRQQLLTAIRANFPALRPTLENNEIHVEPAGLILRTNVFGQTQHPDVLMCTLGVQLSHHIHFPVPIIDCLVSYGTDEFTAVASGAQIYLGGVFATVINALQGRHDPAVDVTVSAGDIWHPIIGELQVQGAWTGQTEELVHEHLFDLLKPLLLDRFRSGPFHWLKMYVSRQPNGKIIGDCLFDNQPWAEGLQKLHEEATHWPSKGHFAGQKQFILFRKCS